MVHGRMLAGNINNWTKFFRQAFGQSKPGGWLEMNEFESKFYLGNDQESVQLNMLVKVFNDASAKFAMRDAGFEDVEDPNLRDLGEIVHRAALESVESYILALGSRILEKKAESIGDIVKTTKNELNNDEYCLYVHAHCICGRRPKYN
ncbi:hypothetical protein UA08_02733 [Talaromyces atroroseus]|uniref:Uncharacterized protein n=1 Tax=Talaromyces atroroseus TaxID=1441469 RepID=A0A225B9B0_TALAT|nr:hypothetical protein UA08_02733 [Talaromyces atroroseus]OKL62547.1 hypothetical protein UA08_02733 [Talaromyces atroroseus]